MIQMRMREYDGIQFRYIDRDRRQVTFSQILKPLEKPAVAQNLAAARLQQGPRSGDGACGAQQGQCESLMLSHVCPDQYRAAGSPRHASAALAAAARFRSL